MNKFNTKIQMVTGEYIYTRKTDKDYALYSRPDITIDITYIKQYKRYYVGIKSGSKRSIYTVDNRKAVYALITYSPYIIDPEYRKFLIANYGSVEKFVNEFCCTFEYCAEKQKEREKNRRYRSCHNTKELK